MAKINVPNPKWETNLPKFKLNFFCENQSNITEAIKYTENNRPNIKIISL